MALGLPMITNDNPPMNEIVPDGVNGLLGRRAARGAGRSRGSPPTGPACAGLAAALAAAAEPGALESLRDGVARARERLSWEHTVGDYAALIGRFG